MKDEHQVNRQYWNSLAARWRQLRDEDQLWRRIPEAPHLGFIPRAFLFIEAYGGDLNGKQVGVLGSGDNYAAFALAALGAEVTSVDFSAEQLAIAAERAAEIGLAERIRFVEADITQLDMIPDASFDLVTSTNGVQVWLTDLRPYYREAARVLRSGGAFVAYDLHPFQRPWANVERDLVMEKPYFERICCDEEDDTYEYHWTMGDILNGIAKAGLVIHRVKEDQAADPSFWEGHSYVPGRKRDMLDWHHNPRAGLPVWLTVAAMKP